MTDCIHGLSRDVFCYMQERWRAERKEASTAVPGQLEDETRRLPYPHSGTARQIRVGGVPFDQHTTFTGEELLGTIQSLLLIAPGQRWPGGGLDHRMLFACCCGWICSHSVVGRSA